MYRLFYRIASSTQETENLCLRTYLLENKYDKFVKFMILSM